jgi:hypothetical protein
VIADMSDPSHFKRYNFANYYKQRASIPIASTTSTTGTDSTDTTDSGSATATAGTIATDSAATSPLPSSTGDKSSTEDIKGV